ncbi:hypothetical protein DFA_07679 [Cavenderia fasciculata]|uniref:SAP DNA-binding domain-containing protein n=1 Tax=Cavenderia fasciculata TaxID=261658 RepID=F4Q2S5_CACFS|nr:uncharacterized protein DFA_07679 [Cavenderia fasciculata]EGG16701.1 hypothetical protein DFA_07679 [Cavenderia fasciculata]|eukprot:XP_004355175.1 hypothetical protein DFA_07679 [Cavenderia fasciculata]
MISQQLQNVIKQFDRLKADSLKQTLVTFGKEVPSAPKKPELLSMIKTLVSGQTYAFLLEDMAFKPIFAGDLKIDVDQVPKEFETHGLSAALDRLSADSLKSVVEQLKLGDDNEAETKAERISRIEEESFLQGVNKMFFKLNKDVLKCYCTDLKVTHSGDTAKDTDQLMKAMYDLEGGETKEDEDEEEQEEEETAAAAPKKPAAKDKKPAAKDSKKPAAKAAAAKDAKKPAEAVKRQARAASKRVPAKPAAAAKSSDSAAGKRVKKPVTKLETEVAATNGKKKAAAAPKRKQDDRDSDSDSDSDSEDQVDTARPTKSNPNKLGGYYHDGKYVNPPISKIAKGVDRDTLHNCFNIEPLSEFCKKEGMTGTSSLNKQKLITKILNYLKGEDVNKKGKVPKSKKKVTKKSKTSSTTSTTTTTSSS